MKNLSAFFLLDVEHINKYFNDIKFASSKNIQFLKYLCLKFWSANYQSVIYRFLKTQYLENRYELGQNISPISFEYQNLTFEP